MDFRKIYSKFIHLLQKLRKNERNPWSVDLASSKVNGWSDG